MKIDIKTIEKLENLSMVEIENKEKMAADLQEIVSFVEMLNELDTEGIEPTFRVLDVTTPLREDEPLKTEIIKDVLAHAPKAKDGYFIVPKIIES